MSINFRIGIKLSCFSPTDLKFTLCNATDMYTDLQQSEIKAYTKPPTLLVRSVVQ